eukprot:TRINITY_DN104487_c0_g1_i1.p1 TRINITY_DN104487_c0_g1~~TRINITY_DN104487_c0_g1_i1.p1  ORF type:complete len:530 (-),score=42.67 TRINITY_DN104487_c0_g1_i1:153-1682(-)
MPRLCLLPLTFKMTHTASCFLLIVTFCTCCVRVGSLCDSEWLQRFPSGWPKKLDAGIYWFGPGDQFEKATGSDASKFYDPYKKTLIWFHGWTGQEEGWVETCTRVTTKCVLGPGECPGEHKDAPLIDKWLEAGWNVGKFYWDQFADEKCARDAEQKIWFNHGETGLRWKSFDVRTGRSEWQKLHGNSLSVGDLCVRQVKAAMRQHSSPEVRFLGHSLGAQLAMRCAAGLHSDNHVAAPIRLTLLEPVFTKYHFKLFRCIGKGETGTSELKEGESGTYTAESTSAYAKSLWETKQVVTEVYKSSMLTEWGFLGETDRELEKEAAFVQYHPDWCGVLFGNFGGLNGLQCRHAAAIPLYLLSFGEVPPRLFPAAPSALAEPGSALLTCPTPSANCSQFALWEWVQRQHLLKGEQKWDQQEGQSTLESKDDFFMLTPLLGRDEPSIVDRAHDSAFHPPEPQSSVFGSLPVGLVAVVAICGLAAVGGLAFYMRRKARGRLPGEPMIDESDPLHA